MLNFILFLKLRFFEIFLNTSQVGFQLQGISCDRGSTVLVTQGLET